MLAQIVSFDEAFVRETIGWGIYGNHWEQHKNLSTLPTPPQDRWPRLVPSASSNVPAAIMLDRQRRGNHPHRPKSNVPWQRSGRLVNGWFPVSLDKAENEAVA